MGRLSSTAGLFLVLAGVMTGFIAAGWTDFADRATRRLGRPCSHSDGVACIVDVRPGTPIHWPPEFHGRRRPGRR